MATDVPFEIDRVRRVLGVWGWRITATEDAAAEIIITVAMTKEGEEK